MGEVLLSGEGKGSSPDPAGLRIPCEFGFNPQGQLRSFEGFRQGPCIPLQLLLLFPLSVTDHTHFFFIPAKAKVILALRILPSPSFCVEMCYKEYSGCSVLINSEYSEPRNREKEQETDAVV